MVVRRSLVLWFTVNGLRRLCPTASLAYGWQMTLQLMLHSLKRR